MTLARKRATKRRTTSPRCERQRCNKRAEIVGLCLSHAEKQAWTEFSLFIRERDARCTAADVFDTDCEGLPMLQAAHIVGRRNQAVRYDPENVHAACPGHHMLIDQAGREHAKYRWATALLGEEHYAALMARANEMGDRREAIRRRLAPEDA